MRADLTPTAAKKAYVALVCAVLIGGIQAAQATDLVPAHLAGWLTVAVAVLTPISVWAARNTPAAEPPDVV